MTRRITRMGSRGAFALVAAAGALWGGCGGGAREGAAPGTGGAPTAGAGGNAGAGSGANAGNTGSGGSGNGGPDSGGQTVACTLDITAAVLANQGVTLDGDACITLPPATTTQYDGVLSGAGTLRITAPAGPGTLVLTADSTFALPAARQTETAFETRSPTDPNHVHYWTIQDPNPPAVFIDPGATLQLGLPTSTTGSIGDYLPSTAGTVINLDNIEVNGTLVLASGPTLHLGILSGAGVIRRPAVGPAGGTLFLVGDNPFSGVYTQLFGGYFGSDHVLFSLEHATIFSNESFIVAAPEGQFGATAGHLLRFPRNIWESHYGDDINTNSGRIIFAGVYSYSNSGDQLKPALSDARLNTMVVQNGTGSLTGGNNSSFRGINIEGGTTEWGDGTSSRFFLPSAPSPAAPDSTVKNAYINLHNGATLLFNYNGRYTCDVGITGGGGGPRADGSVGVGNLTIAPTPGNYAVLTMPQNYNGTTTIGAGATLQLGNGAAVLAQKATVMAPTAAEPAGAVTSVTTIATYTGDSSLLTAESPNGVATDGIVNNGRLLVNNTTTPITLSHISGTGTFSQLGPAPVTLLASTFQGGTMIRGGTLFAADDRALGGGDVANDSVLGIVRGGRRRPATLRVGGRYRQGAGATLRLAVGARLDRAPIQVAGRADLDGTLVLELKAQPRGRPAGLIPPPGPRFALLRARGGIHGRFLSVVAAGFEVALSYDGDTCYATLTRPQDQPRPPGPIALVSRTTR